MSLTGISENSPHGPNQCLYSYAFMFLLYICFQNYRVCVQDAVFFGGFLVNNMFLSSNTFCFIKVCLMNCCGQSVAH